jgi:hypothetical protein
VVPHSLRATSPFSKLTPGNSLTGIGQETKRRHFSILADCTSRMQGTVSA